LAAPNNDPKLTPKSVFIAVSDRTDLESAFVQQVAKPVSRLHPKLILRITLGLANLGGIDVCDPDLLALEPESISINDAGAACNSAELEAREVLPAISEILFASSEGAIEVKPDTGQFNANIPPANTIENAPRPNIHSLRRRLSCCFFSLSRKSKRTTLSSFVPRPSF